MYSARLLEWLDADIGIVGDNEAGVQKSPFIFLFEKAPFLSGCAVQFEIVKKLLLRDFSQEPDALASRATRIREIAV
jgi:hypothetical protein